LIGLGSAVAGLVSYPLISPGRSDILDVVNKNNRLSPEPLQLQLGYDPTRQLAFGRATLAF
jgi:hypothetical protein